MFHEIVVRVIILETQGQGGSAQPAGAGLSIFIPLILMFLVFYFLLIRPQSKKLKEHQKMVSSLKKGDNVITSSGIYGRVVEVGDKTLFLEIADRVKIKISKENISGIVKE